MNDLISTPTTSSNRATPAPLNMAGMAACIAACLKCADACTNCAKSCAAEAGVSPVAREAMNCCMRLDQDCATVCKATADILSRSGTPDAKFMRALMEACQLACAACATECEKHAAHMPDCMSCAAACRVCEKACAAMLG